MDTDALISIAHGRCLRVLCASSGRHFEGLASAARTLLPKGPLKKKLLRLDSAFQIARHISEPAVTSLVGEVTAFAKNSLFGSCPSASTGSSSEKGTCISSSGCSSRSTTRPPSTSPLYDVSEKLDTLSAQVEQSLAGLSLLLNSDPVMKQPVVRDLIGEASCGHFDLFADSSSSPPSEAQEGVDIAVQTDNVHSAVADLTSKAGLDAKWHSFARRFLLHVRDQNRIYAAVCGLHRQVCGGRPASAAISDRP